jgi:4-amino-4-deoxy-L-arabinose transferase-like glycosyltransferase
MIDHLVRAFGFFFCFVWIFAFLSFPFFKGMPLGYVPALTGIALGGVFCFRPVKQFCNRLLDGIPSPHFVAGLCIIGLILRVIGILVFPIEPKNDPEFFHRFALELLQGHGYGDENHKAFFPPGMTFFLAGWYWLTEPSPMAGKCLNALVGIATILLVYGIGRRTASERAAKWAALLAAFMPTLVFYSATLGYELFLGLIFLATTYLALVILDSRGSGLFLCVLLGVVLGFGSLIKPICLPIPALLCIWWWLLGKRTKALLWGAVVTAVMACVVTPWTLRNYREFGEYVLVSTNGGVVLYSANNPNTEGHESAVQPLPGEQDELSRDRIRRKAARDWIRANPDRFLRLAVNKAMFTWGTSTQIMSVVSCDRMPPRQEQACMAIINVFWGALLVQCLAATLRTSIWRERRLYVAFGLLAYVFVIHVISEAFSRHHIPVMGVLFLIASAALARNGERLTNDALTPATSPDQPSRT